MAALHRGNFDALAALTLLLVLISASSVLPLSSLIGSHQYSPNLVRLFSPKPGQRSSFWKSKIMMRAALILVGLSTLAIMELETPPRTTKAHSEPLAQSTVGKGGSRGDSTKTDPLEIPYVQYDAPAPPTSSVERMPPPDVKPIIPQQAPNIIDQRGRDANDKTVVAKTPKPRPKHPDSRKAAKTDRSKATIEVRSCRPNAFDNLIKAKNLSAGCET